MNRSIIIWVVVAVVVLIGVGSYLALYNNNSPVSNGAQSSSSSASPSSNDTKQAVATITYSDHGFSPSSTTVKSGDTVAIVNSSSNSLQMDSGPHPEHTDDTDLNVGLVDAGQTKTFTVKKTGTFGFHNHLNPSDEATIIVQ